MIWKWFPRKVIEAILEDYRNKGDIRRLFIEGANGCQAKDAKHEVAKPPPPPPIGELSMFG